MNAKVTLNFSYKKAGRSITFYKVVANLEALSLTQPGGSNPLHNLISAVMRLQGHGVECGEIRISDDNASGDALFYDAIYISTSGAGFGAFDARVNQVKTATSDHPDFYDTGLLINYAAGPFHRGRSTLPFIPDSLYQAPVGFLPDQFWLNAFADFRAFLIGNSWSVRSLAAVDVNPWKPISTIKRAVAGDNVIVTTLVAHTYNVGDEVRLSKTVGFENKIYTVYEIGPDAATQFKLLDTVGTALNVASKGRVRRLVPTYPVITSVGTRKISRRKAGRPFDSPVGSLSRR